MKDVHQLMELASKQVESAKNKVESDPYRLRFHLMPPVGLLNDPNGLIYFKGRYHVFYQWNPFETAHGAKFWGHYSSPDLISWKAEPIALAPDREFDRNGCYSGSAIEHEGKLYLFYTGNVKNSDGERVTTQCAAVSSDGRDFEKLGPVISLPEGYTPHFRDPKVWQEQDEFFMILGAQTADEQGEAVLYRSKDLSEWEFLGPIAGSGRGGLGSFGYMWECPDFFRLDGLDLLLVSPQGLEPEGDLFQNEFQSGYFAGTLDGETFEFKHGLFTELDRGFDFYAPQTLLDGKGRRLLIAWMGITDEMEPYEPTVKNEWLHALTLPRVLEWREGKLHQLPPEELTQLRKAGVEATASLQAGELMEIPELSGEAMEWKAHFSTPLTGAIEFRVRDEAVIRFDPQEQRFSLERTNFKGDAREIRRCKLERLESIHLYLDTSSIEIFINEGEEVFSARIFPNTDEKSTRMISETPIDFHLQKWDLSTFELTE